MNKIKKFFADETGLELSEYAIAAALVVLGVAAMFGLLGDQILIKITALRDAVAGAPAAGS